MRRAIVLAVLLVATLAVPTTADLTEDSNWQVARQDDFTKIMALAVEEPERARTRLGLLRSSVLDFEPSEECMWPFWAMSIVTIDIRDDVLGYSIEGAAGDPVSFERADALMGVISGISDSTSAMSIVIECI